MTKQEKEEYEQLTEVPISSELIRAGKILEMKVDRVRVFNGQIASRELVRHLGAVCIVPLTEDGQIILERQYRYPIDRVLTEIPAGKLDYADEDPLEAAKRELREETGYHAGEWVYLGDFYPAAAYSDERIRVFLARGLTQGERDLDPDENINLFTVPLGEAVDAVMRGEVPDGKSQLAILKAAEYLKREQAGSLS
ncbi:MAG: NUDIX hydrolase [Lachnospiraceae bacterium]|nr:NUDIX hydrolase [Lachnospiraceae bacterium]